MKRCVAPLPPWTTSAALSLFTRHTAARASVAASLFWSSGPERPAPERSCAGRPPAACPGSHPAFPSAVRGFRGAGLHSTHPAGLSSLSDGLSHVDPDTGAPTMVDVGDKSVTARVAVAESTLFLPEAVMRLIGGRSSPISPAAFID